MPSPLAGHPAGNTWYDGQVSGKLVIKFFKEKSDITIHDASNKNMVNGSICEVGNRGTAKKPQPYGNYNSGMSDHWAGMVAENYQVADVLPVKTFAPHLS
jgi:hypothetical protein